MTDILEFGQVHKKRGEYVNPCGSDYNIVISDLKTLRGVKNRIAKKWWRKNVEFIEIYKIGDTYLNKEQYIDTIENINLGVKERAQPDLALTKDIYSAKVTVNGYEHTYMYNQK